MRMNRFFAKLTAPRFWQIINEKKPATRKNNCIRKT